MDGRFQPFKVQDSIQRSVRTGGTICKNSYSLACRWFLPTYNKAPAMFVIFRRLKPPESGGISFGSFFRWNSWWFLEPKAYLGPSIFLGSSRFFDFTTFVGFFLPTNGFLSRSWRIIPQIEPRRIFCAIVFHFIDRWDSLRMGDFLSAFTTGMILQDRKSVV